ncbi:hypothetical protein LSH36_800g01024 [Paralvinella palmiformis]|uniref:Uncharacterized protein n=1 Tax=Paralvinella palmiformis TaxID=53620 RepID=A0AAD9J0D2_9ANNE|nr:hypothetical protein LSH36_800g01024 [Paralvinella palmiformis]
MKLNPRCVGLITLYMAGLLGSVFIYNVYVSKREDLRTETVSIVSGNSIHTTPAYHFKRNVSVMLDKSLCQIQCQHGHPCEYPDELDFRIIVLTFNRPESLRKCLHHLHDLDTLGDRVGVDIWIDRDKKGHVDNATIQIANKFALDWRKGRACVHIQTKHAYITGQWIDTWRPKPDTKELALILEDDIDLSPLAYKWVKAVRGHYAGATDIAGYTLKMENVMTYIGWRPLRGPKADPVFLNAGFGPWGFVPDPDFWRSFQDWYHRQREDPDFRPYVPRITLTKWYKEGKGDSVWELWFVYYCFVQKRYTLFPNLLQYTGKRDVLLDTNRMEKGLHFGKNSNRDMSRFLMTTWSNQYVKFPGKIRIYYYDGKEIK